MELLELHSLGENKDTCGLGKKYFKSVVILKETIGYSKRCTDIAMEARDGYLPEIAGTLFVFNK